MRFLWVIILFCWHVAHSLTYASIQAFIPGHCLYILAFCIISSLPGCPAVGWSCITCIISLFSSIVGSCLVVIVFMNLCFGSTVTSWLSSFFWSTPGGLDSVSARVLVFL